MPVEVIKLTAPAEGMFDIIPNDGIDLERITRGIYVGVTGNLHVRMIDGTEGTYGNVAAGITHPWRIVRVFAAGTTATGILGQV